MVSDSLSIRAHKRCLNHYHLQLTNHYQLQHHYHVFGSLFYSCLLSILVLPVECPQASSPTSLHHLLLQPPSAPLSLYIPPTYHPIQHTITSFIASYPLSEIFITISASWFFFLAREHRHLSILSCRVPSSSSVCTCCCSVNFSL